MAMRIFAPLLGCVALAGCATESEAEGDPSDFSETAAGVIAEAETGGAGDAQFAFLQHAQADGRLTIETAWEAARAVVQCVNDAGSLAQDSEHADESGLVTPGWNASANRPEEQAISDRSDMQEGLWANLLYGTQPDSLQVNEVYLEQQASVVRTCLEREGYATAPDATTHELLRQASKVASETKGGIDCLAGAKIDNF